jgi:uridine phosphorylase
MKKVAESELVLNPDGSVYHLHLRPENIADTVITVGDPDRVEEISKHFDTIEFKTRKREFVTHTGILNNKRLTVLSTGIGPDNIDIVLNELDAAVNFDLNTRQPKTVKTSLEIIRLGTCGSLQADIPADDIVVSTHGIGLDNLLHFYPFENEVADIYLLEAFNKQVMQSAVGVVPYICQGSSGLIHKLGKGHHQGITLTCPGFYGPQGRSLRLTAKYAGIVQRASDFKFHEHRITNFEMETAAMYGLGQLLGHECISISVILANRTNGTFSANPQKAVDKLIVHMLERISHL